MTFETAIRHSGNSITRSRTNQSSTRLAKQHCIWSEPIGFILTARGSQAVKLAFALNGCDLDSRFNQLLVALFLFLHAL